MRYALRLWTRRFSRQPALTVFLLASLALALGGGTAALSLANAVLWRELPFDEASRLIDIEPRRAAPTRAWLSKAEVEAIAGSPSPFAAVAGYTAADFSARAEPGVPPEPLLGTLVTPDFFRVFRIQLSMGQLPLPDSYTPGGERVVLISHELWQRRYRGAGDIVGRQISLAGPEYLDGADGVYRVIGVLSPRFWLFWKRTDIVLPFRPDANRAVSPEARVIERIVGRLAPEAGIDGARAAADAMVARIRAAGSGAPVATVAMSALQEALFRDVRPHLVIVALVAGLVFLLAATNVALSAATEALHRRRETAIRMAVGARHGRLLLETFRETSISVAVAGVTGVLLALWLIGALVTQVPGGWIARLPGQESAIRIDRRVGLSLFLGLSALALASSAAVHLAGRRLRPWSLLASAAAADAPASRGWRAAVVACEIALCAAAVITATVLASQFSSLRAVDLGVDTDRAVAMWISLDGSKYKEPSARSEYFARLITEIRQASGVQAVGGIDLPFHFTWQTDRLRVEGRPDISELNVLVRAATPEYLEASGIGLREGRWLTPADRRGGADVAVVSESLARALWPDGRALGQVVRTGTGAEMSPAATVVGVVSDTRHAAQAPPDRILYRAVAQAPPPWLYFIVRSPAPAADVMSAVTAAAWRVDPDQPFEGPWTMQSWIDVGTSHLRFLVVLTTVFAALGAALAAAGLYGLTAYWVAESRRDLGIRRAVGARDRQIAVWFGLRVFAVVLPGLAVGVLLHVGAMRGVVSAIDGLQPSGWLPLAAGLALVSACAAAGALVPFRRALAADALSLMR